MSFSRIGSAIFVLAALVGPGCAPVEQGSEAGGPEEVGSMNSVAEEYVKLVLSLGRHDADYVDAYYGPPQWRADAEQDTSSTAELLGRADALLGQLEQLSVDDDEMASLRHRYLTTQLRAMVSRIRLLDGAQMSFDEESRALYDAVAPTRGDDYFQAVLDELDPLLPGSGSLTERYESFRNEFVIPPDRLDAVFRASIEACRQRTLQHLELPEGESFELEYVTDKSWSGYNWYKGDFHSLIQVNTDLPIYIDRAIDLACHEGYPGHHTYNVLLEKHLVRDRGWVEFTVYPLFSPQSLIAEGTANYGIEVAFPGDERMSFERERLFPLAGLDPDRAERYYRVQEQVDRLGFAGNETARRFLQGEIDAEAAAEHLMHYALMPRARAEKRVQFITKYRSYVINYNLGKDLVRDYIESLADPVTASDRSWEEFGRLISSPRLPSGLVR